MERNRRLSVAALLGVALAACAQQTPDDAAVCAAYTGARSGIEVVAAGKVTRLLGVAPGRTSPHEGFLLRLDSGCDVIVRVEVNTDFTGDIPLDPNEHVVVKGEYEYYPLGGVIHWTHHDPRGRHDSGYIDAGGRMYY
jgi:uncharacterized protein DUF3465